MRSDRRQTIIAALSAELARQGKTGIDIGALADAVETALGNDLSGAMPTIMSEGKAPDELNATNDD